MYQITLFDENSASCCSFTFSCYCEDIEEFEREWLKLVQDERQVERFRRSKAGELVTDFHPTKHDEKLNIVQHDPETVVYSEYVLTKEDLRMTAKNAYDWSSVILADRGEFHVKYIRFQGKYLKLVKYKLYGACKERRKIYQELSCYGNKILILNQDEDAPYQSEDRKVYRNDTVESIAFYPVKKYDSLEELQQACQKPAEWFADMELVRLLEDIPGKAG